jgi:hypothetical protein
MEITVTFNEQDLKNLNDALIERPYKEVAELIYKINLAIKDAQNNT